MSDGPTDSPDEGGGGPEEGPILSPEELDLDDDEHVTEIDEGRYVVSPDVRDAGAADSAGGASRESRSRDTQPTDSPDPDPVPGSEGGPTSPRADPRGDDEVPDLTEAEVHAWLERTLADSPSRYSFDVTATFEDATRQRRMASNDVVTIFESLVLWYAQGIDRDTPVEEVLGILLMESNVPIRFPAASLQRLVSSTDLGPEDSIGDLLATVESRDGFRL